jgi:hypothetical protein
MQAMARNTKTMARRPTVESRAMTLLLNIIKRPDDKSFRRIALRTKKETHTHTHSEREAERKRKGKSVGVWSRDRDVVVLKT